MAMKKYRWHIAFVGWCLLVAVYVLLTQPMDQQSKQKEQPKKTVVEKAKVEKVEQPQKMLEQTVANVTLPPPPALPESQKPAAPQSEEPTVAKADPEPEPVLVKQQPVAKPQAIKRETPKPIAKKTIVKNPVVKKPNAAPEPEKQVSRSTERKLKSKQHQASAKRVLTMLESGKGPVIHIQWPTSERDREWIKQRLYQCGVKLGKYQRGRLTAIEKSYQDFSGFIRIPDDRLNASERSRLERLNGAGKVVRVFPRYLDVNMLAGLSVLNANTLQAAKDIRIRYVRESAGLAINGVQVDGKSIPSNFLLLGNRQCSAS